jgi:hypothetical protein
MRTILRQRAEFHSAAMKPPTTRIGSAILIVAGMVMLAAPVGCHKGSGMERIPLSGTVTFRGEAVSDGQIRFCPRPDTAAPLTIATIKDGHYDTTTVGGVPVGRHGVEIRSFDPKTPPPKGPDDPQRKQLLPAKYNRQSTLELTVESGDRNLNKDYRLEP